MVEKDKSFQNQIDNGFETLEPMAKFRDWLKDYCYNAENRMKQRRNGQEGLGPLTFEARKKVLDDLLALQTKVSQPLISEDEISLIYRIWKQDESQNLIHRANKLLALIGAP